MILTRKNGEQIEVFTDKGIANACFQVFKTLAPHRSGALKGKIRVEYTKSGFDIISDIWYMPYTEEKWISPRWRGRQNPNEGWFKEAFEVCIRMISTLTGKEFKRES